MEEIAALQGISKKTLYRYFPNKEALVAAAIEERIAEVAEKIAEIARRADLSFLERIQQILRTASRQTAEIGEGLVRDLYYNHPELWVRIDHYRQIQSAIPHATAQRSLCPTVIPTLPRGEI